MDAGQSEKSEEREEKETRHEVNIADESTNSDEFKSKKLSEDLQRTTNSTHHITESTEIVGKEGY